MSYVGRVHAFIIGVGRYDDRELDDLDGPAKDVANMRDVLTGAPVGLYQPHQVTVLEDPTLDEVRGAIVEYVKSRSAKGDICLVYFAGHGCVLRGNEFGFCFRDAALRPDGGDVLPLSVLKFSDLLATLATADVIPTVIIDACNSGVTGWATSTGMTEAMGALHDDLHRSAGTTYALLCACSERHTAADDSNGGAFTSALVGVLEGGLDGGFLRKRTLSLSDAFAAIYRACEQVPDIGQPRLYVSPDLPAFEICKNVAYRRLAYSFSTYMKELIEELWNGGNPREMTLDQIRAFGAAAYGNHTKLSYGPWSLVEDVPNATPRKRRLTSRGRRFARDSLRIPIEIEKDDAAPTGFRATPGAQRIKISEL